MRRAYYEWLRGAEPGLSMPDSATTNPAEAGSVQLPSVLPAGYFFSSSVNFDLSAAMIAFSALSACRSW